MAVNDRIHDFVAGRQIDLVRAANGRTGSLLRGTFADADEGLAGVLALVESPDLTPRQLERLMERVDRILAPQAVALRADVADFVRGLSAAELEAAEGLFERVFAPLGIDAQAPTAGQAALRARRAPMRGTTISAWVRQLLRNDRERVRRQVQATLGDDRGGRRLVAAVVGSPGLGRRDGVRQVTRRGVATLYQTLATHVAAQTRELFYETNPDLVREERWVATLDGRTSFTCRALDGRTFPVGRGVMPPAHPNCRSARMPIVPKLKALPVDGEARDVLPATVAEQFDGSGPQVLTYERWLRGRSARFQRDVLGDARFRLWRTGEISLDRFVNDANRQLTLDELRQRVPGLFEEVGL